MARSKSGVGRTPKSQKIDSRVGKFCFVRVVDGKRKYLSNLSHQFWCQRKCEAEFFTQSQKKKVAESINKDYPGIKFFFEKFEDKVAAKDYDAGSLEKMHCSPDFQYSTNLTIVW